MAVDPGGFHRLREALGNCLSSHKTIKQTAARMEPITFSPIYMTRVWGGRELERVYGRDLPDPDLPFGESWEISDREDAQSTVDEGPFTGTTLHELWTNHREEIFGSGFTAHPCFPILIKILDARDDLSIQVHPPRHMAESLVGEPKTEMWYIADRDHGAKLHVGLRKGVSRDGFEQAITRGTVADCVQPLEALPGQSIFIPSGRVHAIGKGFLIHEIQQNSDTTYRVFDWNRLGHDGKPRQLHVAESLASIDFNDFEPAMDTPMGETLAYCEYFRTDRKYLQPGEVIANFDGRFSILSIIKGELESAGGRSFMPGQSVLLPRGAEPLKAHSDSAVLQITLPISSSFLF